MKNTIYFLFIFFFSLGVSQENKWRWQQKVDYTMVIDVDVENHTYKGTQNLVYTNNSPDDLDRVFYHLYFNAFKPGTDLEQNSRYSTDDSRTMSKNILMLDEKDWGDVQIKWMLQDGVPIEFKTEETILDEVIEDTNLMVIELSLKTLFQMVKIFKEKFQEEIIIMPQS